jgi:hypothetical protein
MEAQSILLEHTLILSGDTVDSASVWQGWPSKTHTSLDVYRDELKQQLRRSTLAYERQPSCLSKWVTFNFSGLFRRPQRSYDFEDEVMHSNSRDAELGLRSMSSSRSDESDADDSDEDAHSFITTRSRNTNRGSYRGARTVRFGPDSVTTFENYSERSPLLTYR